MRRPVAPRRGGVKINLTPLIDVVFNLVIFFLVASHFAWSEPAEAVSLPHATQGEDEEHPRRLTVTILPEGRALVGGKEVSMHEIDQLIADGAGEDPGAYWVRVRADQATPYQFIEPVMLSCAKHGVTKFGFHVVKKEAAL
jgi:biopolymer transport protein ExbD